MNPRLDKIFLEIGATIEINYHTFFFQKKYGDYVLDYAPTMMGGIRICLREKDDFCSVGLTNWCIGTQYELIVPLTKFICEMVDAGREANLPDYSRSKPLYWDAVFLHRLRSAGLKTDNQMLNALLWLKEQKIDIQQVIRIFERHNVPALEIKFKTEELTRHAPCRNGIV